MPSVLLCQLNYDQVISQNAMHMHLVQDDVMHKVRVVSFFGNLIKFRVRLDVDFGVKIIATNQSGACTAEGCHE